MLKGKVLFPKGLFFQTSRLPADWAILSTPNGTVDVFILSKEELNQEDVVAFEPVSFCRIRESEGVLSDILVAIAAGDTFSSKELKIAEAKLGKFINQNWKIRSWGNKDATLQLLRIEYNVNI